MLSDSPSKVVYDLASTTPISDGYEVTFTYFDKDEIQVYLEGDDGKETQISSEKYTVDESDTTAAVLFSPGYTFPAGSKKLVIMRIVAYEQETDYRNGDKMNADDIERSFDYLTAMVQQLAEIIDRTIQKPKSETGDIILPSVEQRAGMLLGFDDDGNFKPVLTSDIDQKLSQALAAEESAIAAAESAIQIEDHIASMVTKIKDSESNASYFANATKLWANKAIDAANLAAAIKNSCNTILGQIQTIQTTVQGIQSDVQDRQDDVISRQNDIISRQSSVASMQQSVETDKGVVAVDKASVETLKEQAVAAKTGAEATAAEIAALKTQIAALAGSTMPGMTFAVGTKIYQRSFYVKNGRTYFHDEEVQQNTN